MILSMLATPFVIAASDTIVLRLSRSEWMLRSLELHRVAVQSLEAERHVIIVGYGRNGQRLARLLDAEGVRYIALDLDPERVREAVAGGDTVVFADGLRPEALSAAGISRAAAVVLTFADAAAAKRVLAHLHELHPAVPVIVRARDEADIEPLTAAGASEVVPEAFESGLMLASHTLVWVGVPLSRVMRRVSQVRGERYGLLRGLFQGRDATKAKATPRRRACMRSRSSPAPGRWAAASTSSAWTRSASKCGRCAGAARSASCAPAEAGELQAGDVVVLLGRARGARRRGRAPRGALTRTGALRTGRLQRAAEHVDVGAGFRVGRRSRPGPRRSPGSAPPAAARAPCRGSTRRRPSACRPRSRSCPAGWPST